MVPGPHIAHETPEGLYWNAGQASHPMLSKLPNWVCFVIPLPALHWSHGSVLVEELKWLPRHLMHT
jgi:hypothetical protein